MVISVYKIKQTFLDHLKDCFLELCSSQVLLVNVILKTVKKYFLKIESLSECIRWLTLSHRPTAAMTQPG